MFMLEQSFLSRHSESNTCCFFEFFYRPRLICRMPFFELGYLLCFHSSSLPHFQKKVDNFQAAQHAVKATILHGSEVLHMQGLYGFFY